MKTRTGSRLSWIAADDGADDDRKKKRKKQTMKFEIYLCDDSVAQLFTYHEVVRIYSCTDNLQIDFVKKAINVSNTRDDLLASF